MKKKTLILLIIVFGAVVLAFHILFKKLNGQTSLFDYLFNSNSTAGLQR